jgi:ankyrin repeat protein
MHRYRYHRKGRAGLSMLASSRMLLLPHSYEAAVKLLLDKEGLDPDSKNADGRTLLSRAAKNGHGAVVKLLQSRGALSL